MPSDSAVHRLDPRLKILLTCILMFCSFALKGFYQNLFFLIFLVFIILVSKISVKYIIKGIKSILFLIGMTFFFNLFLTGGEIVFNSWIFKIYSKGLHTAVTMSLRIIYLVVITSILTLTTSPLQMTDAIERMLLILKKIKVPAHEIALMLTISIRFIPILILETEKIMKAQIARGLELDTGSFIKRVKNFIPILIPLFIHVFKSSDDLAVAMESRCFVIGQERTKMKVLKADYSDLLSVIVVGILLVFIMNLKK